MPVFHEIWLTDENGLNLTPLTNNLGGNFWRITDGIGPCKLTMPGTFDWKMLKQDMMIHYWRQPTGGQFGLFRSYFLRRWFPHYNADGDIVIDLYGRDAVDLLRRRIIAAFMGSANATKVATEVDDMMKDFVTDMESDVIDPTPDAGTRDWTGFSVQPDLVIGPQLDKSAAWGNVLQVCVDLAKASRGEGNEVFFTVDDILSGNSEITFEFRTTINQPGQDVSDRVVFSTENGTLTGAGMDFDYTEEINYIYGLGQGETVNQNIQQVSDAARYGASKWNRCEGSAYAGGQETAAEVRDVARAALTAGRPRRIFSGIPVDSAGLIFGKDWHWGDKVGASTFGFQFTPIVRKVAVIVDAEGNERVSSFLEFED